MGKIFYSTAELLQVVPLSRTSVWRLESQGLFPKRRQITPQRVGWLVSEVEKWAESRPFAQPDPDVLLLALRDGYIQTTKLPSLASIPCLLPFSGRDLRVVQVLSGSRGDLLVRCNDGTYGSFTRGGRDPDRGSHFFFCIDSEDQGFGKSFVDVGAASCEH